MAPMPKKWTNLLVISKSYYPNTRNNMRYLFSLVSIGMLIVAISQLSACHSNLDIKTAQYAVNGQKLYKTHCENCHGTKGEGLGKLYPPLTDRSEEHTSELQSRENLVCRLLPE